MKIPADITDRIKVDGVVDTQTASWKGRSEVNLLLVLEAYRRFLDITQDPRQAAGLTLAWASLEGGDRAYPGV